jgi:hypothetical protein
MRAAAFDQLERDVKVDLAVFSYLDGDERLVTGLQQFVCAPRGHALRLGLADQLGVSRVRHSTYFGLPSLC